MPRVVHFEIHAENPERAAKFYTDLFGWQITKWDGPAPYWLVNTGEGAQGINGGILNRKGSNPAGGDIPLIGYVCTIDVPNLDQFLTKATQLGSKICVPKMPITGVGWLAYCNDTEGNVFGMMQMDKSVK